jgi:hypothetical protein
MSTESVTPPDEPEAAAAEEDLDEAPPPTSVYVAWALALAATFAGLVVALSVAGDASTGFWSVCAAGVAVVLAGAGFLAYRVESRKHTLAVWRREALDLAAAVSGSCTRLAVPWLDRAEQGNNDLWERAVTRVRELEGLILDAGGYADAEAVGAARREAEKSLCQRERA